jgi:hypothetical protein
MNFCTQWLAAERIDVARRNALILWRWMLLKVGRLDGGATEWFENARCCCEVLPPAKRSPTKPVSEPVPR